MVRKCFEINNQSLNRCVDTGIAESEKINKKTDKSVEETNEKDKEEEQISNMDPRKLGMYCSCL